jgi:ssRNA-specific RNase YbeY (16S rRNA maturation enzyme)
MITVLIYKESNYPLPTQKVKKKLREVLKKKITSNASVSLAFVGKEKMEELVQKYYKEDPQKKYVHPILTFPSAEMRDEFRQKGTPDLGEIIISYEEVDSEEKLLSLVEHGALHLIGVHH